MRRRELILLLGGVAITWPGLTAGQPADRMRRLGMLMGAAQTDPQARAFAKGLEELGWTDGRNIRIDYRAARGDAERARAQARELIALGPDAIFVSSTPAIPVLLREARTIPIVFANVAGPVERGLVQSLAHPGGNITGFTNYEPVLGGKWTEFLKEIAPAVARVAILFNPDTATGGGSYYLRPVETAARAKGMEPVTAAVRNDAQIDEAIGALAHAPRSGLFVMPDAFTYVRRVRIVELAARHRVPAIYSFRDFTVAGGLLSYGVDIPDLFRQAASYVDRVLRGASPSDLPVQQPTKFELVINLKTARALGLTVPPALLARADQVIR